MTQMGRFLLYPKNFAKIASYISTKSIAECVAYYYASKKEENYKAKLEKKRKRQYQFV